MSTRDGLRHVVVDGSNIATEGRSMPSLHQLQEAVMSFMEEHPDTAVTVVVDATFGHRIDKKESKEFEEGIANNELVAPPAGAVGRGDAFVLGIADKSGASILSNDSFQEFHAEYEWLFDEGRLIGGKPVPHVGWVWVDRLPVRGPVSRKATGGRGGRGGRSRSKSESTVRTGSKEASGPMPVPTSPPPTAKQTEASSSDASSGKRSGSKRASSKRASSRRGTSDESTAASQEAASGSGASSKDTGRSGARRSSRSTPSGQDPVNELMPFLDFVEQHQPGTAVEAVVESYSSHGAYVALGGDVRGYVPLRLMAEPAPRSAKQIMKIDDTVDLVVVSFAPKRRSIDLAVPELAEAAIAAAKDEAGDEAADESTAASKTAATKTAAKRTATKKTATKKTAAKKTAAKRTATKKAAAKKTAVKKAAAKKTAARKTVAKKTVAKKTAAQSTATPKAAVKKTAAKKTAAKKTAAKKTAAKKTAAKKTAAKKTAAKKTAAKTTTARTAAAKKTAGATRRSSRRTTNGSTEEN